MDILLLLIPLSALIVIGAIVVYLRAVDTGQFDDLERLLWSAGMLDRDNLLDSTFNYSEKAMIAIGMALLIIVRDIDLSVAAIVALCSLLMGFAASAGADTAVSIRQHEARLLGNQPTDTVNAVEAKVVRNVFLGATRDYIVEAKDGTQLRVTAAPEANFAPGAQVWLALPAAACRALVG